MSGNWSNRKDVKCHFHCSKQAIICSGIDFYNYFCKRFSFPKTDIPNSIKVVIMKTRNIVNLHLPAVSGKCNLISKLKIVFVGCLTAFLYRILHFRHVQEYVFCSIAFYVCLSIFPVDTQNHLKCFRH